MCSGALPRVRDSTSGPNDAVGIDHPEWRQCTALSWRSMWLPGNGPGGAGQPSGRGRFCRSGLNFRRLFTTRRLRAPYVLGLGIDTARLVAGQSNEELNQTLAAASALSKSLIWELRRPIDGGLIFEGGELGQALRVHTERFGSIASVSVDMVQLGDEPALSVETRSRLFSVAHNALANALLHSCADRVGVTLDFRGDLVVLSVWDDGVGLPDDYSERGRGFAGMRADAELLGRQGHGGPGRAGGRNGGYVPGSEKREECRRLTCLKGDESA